jgi:hypothetical protein
MEQCCLMALGDASLGRQVPTVFRDSSWEIRRFDFAMINQLLLLFE